MGVKLLMLLLDLLLRESVVHETIGYLAAA